MSGVIEIAAMLEDDAADRWFGLMEDLDAVTGSTDYEVDLLSRREYAERMYGYNPAQKRAPKGTNIGGRWVRDLLGGSDADKMVARRRARQEREEGTPAFQAGGVRQITSIPRPTPGNQPISVGGDVDLAIQLLGQGKAVSFDQPRGVHILIDRLREITKDAQAKGMEAPVYDLCGVTVRNTSLFCVKNKGIPRIQMPQLSGVPEPGSPGDKLPRDARGNVDLLPQFLEHLQAKGATLRSDEQHASHLLATQNELDGRKVAGIMGYLEGGGVIEGSPLLVTEDDYIIDGHHRWAAQVGFDAGDNDLHNGPRMQLTRVGGMDILDVLREAMEFGVANGLQPQAVDQSSKDVIGKKAAVVEPQTNDSPPTYEMTDAELEIWGLASTEQGRSLRSLPGAPLSRREARAQRRAAEQAHLPYEIGHSPTQGSGGRSGRLAHLVPFGPDDSGGATFGDPYTGPDGTTTYSVSDSGRSLGLIREKNGRFEAVVMGRKRGSSRTMSSVGTFRSRDEAVNALRPKDLSGRVVRGPDDPRAARASGLPPKPAWWDEPSDNGFFEGTKGEEIENWLERHSEAVRQSDGRYRFYHAAPKGGARDSSKTLKAGSLLETDPEAAAFFAARDRDLKRDEVVVWTVDLLPEEINTGHWASVRNEHKVGGPEPLAGQSSRVIHWPGVSGFIGASPARTSRKKLDEVERYFQSPRFRSFENSISAIAAEEGIDLKAQRAAGFWQGDMEASAAIEFDNADPASVDRVAGKLGRKYNQDAVAVFRSGGGPGARYTIKAEDPAAALAAIEAAGIDGATIRGSEIVILDPDGSMAAVAAQLALALGDGMPRFETGDVRFLEHGRDYEEDSRRAVRRRGEEARTQGHPRALEARARGDHRAPG
jgi:hypothetical protein